VLNLNIAVTGSEHLSYLSVHVLVRNKVL